MCKGPEDDEDHSSDEDDDNEPHAKKGTREIVLELDNNNLPLIPEYDKPVPSDVSTHFGDTMSCMDLKVPSLKVYLTLPRPSSWSPPPVLL